MCTWRVKTGWVKGIGEDDFTIFYLEGRAENTVRNYGGAFRFVWSVFEWGKGEVAGLMVKIAKEEKGENFMKKSLAVVNMLFKASGIHQRVCH